MARAGVSQGRPTGGTRAVPSRATAVANRPRLYRARHPERTVLHRALAHHLERFLLFYEERFERTHGHLRPCVQRAAHRYLDCGIFAQGAARVHCEECGHDFLVAFSCKQRSLCPSCHQNRELQWAAWAEEELLAEVPHRQVVLTLPKRLRIFFRFDRRLLGELLGCAWRAWRLYFDGALEASLTPGGVGFVQTAGELLGWHPHVHMLLTDGGFLADGTFRHLLWVDAKQLERLWRAEVLRLLKERGKINDEVVHNLLSWRHSGFSVHAGVRVEERREAARLGRYMARCPIVLDRLEWDASSQEVVIHPRPSRRRGPYAECERLDVLAFLARVLDHVPEPRQQQVRYGGWYSNAARGKRRKALVESEVTVVTGGAELTSASRHRRLTWARLIKKVYEPAKARSVSPARRWGAAKPASSLPPGGSAAVSVLRLADEHRGVRGRGVLAAPLAAFYRGRASGTQTAVAGASGGRGACVPGRGGLKHLAGPGSALAELCPAQGKRARLGLRKILRARSRARCRCRRVCPGLPSPKNPPRALWSGALGSGS